MDFRQQMSNTGFFVKSIAWSSFIDFICENGEFVLHLRYNTEKKHRFVPFEILDVLFRREQHEYDNPVNPYDLYVPPFTAAQRYSNKNSTTDQLSEDLGPLHILLN